MSRVYSTHQMYDYVLNGGTVVLTEKNLVTVCNLAIQDGKIVRLTRENISGRLNIDCAGFVVSPGFIDIHAHVEGNKYIAGKMAEQGITTTVGGNCGISPYPVSGFLDRIEEFSINVATLVGHSFALRKAVGLTDIYASASARQVEQMEKLCAEAFMEGAFGVSFGLDYVPGTTFEEILSCAGIAARYNKLVSIHVRGDSWEGIRGIAEAIDVAERTGARVQVSHLVYMVGMGMMDEAISLLDQARNKGLDVYADTGVHTAWMTFIGGAPFEDPDWIDRYGATYEDLYIVSGKYGGMQADKSLFYKAREEDPEATFIAFVGKEADVQKALLWPYVCISTDGGIGNTGPGEEHPHDTGTFPRVLAQYVRERRVITLLDAVKKMAALPAQILGLSKKGALKVGNDADIVVFDMKNVRDKSDYPCCGDPSAPSEGIKYVFVNGVPVVFKGKLDHRANSGKALYDQNIIWEL